MPLDPACLSLFSQIIQFDISKLEKSLEHATKDQKLHLVIHQQLEQIGESFASLKHSSSELSLNVRVVKDNQAKIQSLFHSFAQLFPGAPTQVSYQNTLKELQVLLAYLESLETQEEEVKSFHLYQFIEQNLWIQERLQEAILQEDQHSLEIVIEFYKKNISWAHHFLPSIMIHPDFPIALLNFFICECNELRPWSCNLLFSILNQSEVKKVDQKLQAMLDKIFPWTLKEGFEKLYNLFIVMASELSLYNGFIEYFTLYLNANVKVQIEPSPPSLGHSRFSTPLLMDQVNRLRNLPSRIELSQDKEALQEIKWTDYSLDLRIAVKMLSLQREQALIHFVLNDFALDPLDSNYESLETLFPYVDALIVGVDEDKDLSDDLAKKLSQAFNIRIYRPEQVQEIPTTSSSFDHPIALFGERKPFQWVQDLCTIYRHQSEQCLHIQLPAFANHKDLSIAEFSMSRSYRIRGTFPDQEFIDIEMHMQSASIKNGKPIEFIDYMRRIGAFSHHMHLQFTLVEGGNILRGEDDKGPYVILGRDAFEMSCSLLQQELSSLRITKLDKKWVMIPSSGAKFHPLSEEELEPDLLAFFARDCKVNPDRIYIIEQPDYHLDMSMVIVNERHVLLNDSLAAFEMIKSDLVVKGTSQEILVKLEKYAKGLDLHERATLLDLEKNQFHVQRIPGRFIYYNIYKAKPRDEMNFFNFITLTSQDQKKIVIALGCSDKYKKLFEESVLAKLGTHIDAVVYINEEISQALLSNNGGIRCMTKRITALQNDT